MRSIPNDLAAELASGATTLCRCWKALRRDGRGYGFTDHDRDIAFDGVVFTAATGLEASEAESLLGLAVGGGEIAGALQAATVSEADISAGLWDDAAIETWLVDWRKPARRLLLDAGTIGEIRRQGDAFTAEVRSLAHRLDEERGRRYEALCSAELGDARCRVELAAPGRRVSTTIAAVGDAASFAVAMTDGFPAGIFTGGVATLNGAVLPILSHARSGSMDMIALCAPPAQPLSVGATVTLTVGCDKSFATCRDRFANTANFRGFPHIPGNDLVGSYARQGEPGQDGGAATP
jgi:uncharacterized phage protein (TIGR02218 family)